MKGIILAGGQGTRLRPLTSATSKQLLPVYDKPMIYYPISTLMHMGIREIALISDNQNLEKFQKLLGDGSVWGISIEYFLQPKPEGIAQAYKVTKEFIDSSNSCLILGDNIFVAQGLRMIANKPGYSSGAHIYAYEVSNPGLYGNILIKPDGTVENIIEKPHVPISNFAVPGLYILDSSAPDKFNELRKSSRGEYEIIDLLKLYVNEGSLHASALPRGSAWFDTGSVSDLFNAAEYIKVIQNRQGQIIGSPEEIAFRNGWKSEKDLLKSIPENSNSEYYERLRKLFKSGSGSDFY